MKLNLVFLFCLGVAGAVRAMEENEKKNKEVKKAELKHHVSELFTTPESLQRFGFTLSTLAKQEDNPQQKIRLLENAVLKLEKAADGYANRGDSPSARRLRSGSIAEIQQLMRQLSLPSMENLTEDSERAQSESAQKAEKYVEIATDAWQKAQELERKSLECKKQPRKILRKGRKKKAKAIRKTMKKRSQEKNIIDHYITAHMIFCEAAVEFCNAFLDGFAAGRDKAITMLQRAQHLALWLDLHDSFNALLEKEPGKDSLQAGSGKKALLGQSSYNEPVRLLIDTAWEIFEKCDGIREDETDAEKIDKKRSEFYGILAKVRFNHAKNAECCSEQFRRHLYAKTTEMAYKAAQRYIALDKSEKAQSIMEEFVQPIEGWLLELDKLAFSVSHSSQEIWETIRETKERQRRQAKKMFVPQPVEKELTAAVRAYLEKIKQFEAVQALHEKARKAEDFKSVQKEYLDIVRSCIDVYAENSDPIALADAKRVLLLVKEIEDWKFKHNKKNDENTKTFFQYQVALACANRTNEKYSYQLESSSSSSSSGSDEASSEIITAPYIVMSDEIMDLFKQGKKAHEESKKAWQRAYSLGNIIIRKKQEKQACYKKAEEKGLEAARCFMGMYHKEEIGADWCVISWDLAKKAGKKRHSTKKYYPPQGQSDLKHFVRLIKKEHLEGKKIEKKRT